MSPRLNSYNIKIYKLLARLMPLLKYAINEPNKISVFKTIFGY